MKSYSNNIFILFIALCIFIYILLRLYNKKKIYDHISKTYYGIVEADWKWIPDSISLQWKSLFGSGEKEGLGNMNIANAGFNSPGIKKNSFKYIATSPGTNTAILPNWVYYADSGSLVMLNGKNAFTGGVKTGQAVGFQGGKLQSISQDLTLTPGKYTVNVWLCGRPGKFYTYAHSVQIVYGDFMSPIYNSIPNNTWRNYSFSFTIPSGQTMRKPLKFIVRSPGTSDTTMMLTNVSLVQTQELPIDLPKPIIRSIAIATPSGMPTTATSTTSTTTSTTTPTTTSTTTPTTTSTTTPTTTATTATTTATNITPEEVKKQIVPVNYPSITKYILENPTDPNSSTLISSLKTKVEDELLKKQLTPVNYTIITKYILANPEDPNSSIITSNIKSKLESDFLSEKEAEEKRVREEQIMTSNYDDPNNLPLKEYAIKSSYHSAYNGKMVSLKSLKLNIANGYRFIDLQIFQGVDDVLYVGYSDDKNTTLIDATLPLHVALKYISTYAFSTDQKLNEEVRENEKEPLYNNGTFTSLPLFLNLRFYRRKESSNIDIIKKLYDEHFKSDGIFSKSSLLRDNNGKAIQISGNTRLSNIGQRKIAIVMDINNILKYYTDTNNPKDIKNETKEILDILVNIKTGGHTWKSFVDYNDIMTMEKYPLFSKDNGYETNTKNMYIAFPSSYNRENPDTISFMKNYKIQTIPMRTYIKDNELERNVTLFKRSLIPIRNVLFFE